MKKVDYYFDKFTKIKTSVFQLRSGVQLVHSINENSTEFNASIAIKAGTFYEKEVDVPHGTSHFLEHILAGSNPNKKFKSGAEKRSYLYGTRFKPSIYANASTTNEYVFYYAKSHYKGSSRILKYLYSELDSSLDFIENSIEKERKIILAEISRRPVDEKWSWLNYAKFIQGDVYPEFAQDSLGTASSVRNITKEDIIKYLLSAYSRNNVILTIQSPKELTNEEELILEKVSELFPIGTELKSKKRKLNINFKYGYLQHEEQRGIFVSFNFIYKNLENYDYSFLVKMNLLQNLFYKLAHDYLREEKHLIYGAEVYNERLSFDNYRIRGFKLSCELENFKDVMDGVYFILHTYLEDFLSSQEGRKWFEGEISSYIYKRNINYNPDYAEAIGLLILEGRNYKYDFSQAKKEAKKIMIEDFYLFVKQFIKNTPPSIWMISAHQEAKIYDILRSSNLYRAYSQQLHN